MIFIGRFLAIKGYILCSGGANGADAAFEIGCDLEKGLKEIYIPWKGFNNHSSDLYEPRPEAFEMASKIHPAWSSLSQGAQKLHARNCHQVLGPDLKCPSNFLVCWTVNGEDIGGTRTAIILARKNGIPIYNLGKNGDYLKFKKEIVR